MEKKIKKKKKIKKVKKKSKHTKMKMKRLHRGLGVDTAKGLVIYIYLGKSYWGIWRTMENGEQYNILI